MSPKIETIICNGRHENDNSINERNKFSLKNNNNKKMKFYFTGCRRKI